MKLPAGFGAAVIADPSNMYYFTGYRNADAVVVFTADGRRYYITDGRCLEEAAGAIDGFETVDVGPKSYIDKAIDILKPLKNEKIGLEYDTLKQKDYARLAASFAETGDISEAVYALRAVKSDSEIAAIKAAQKITDRVFEEVLERVSGGNITEKELASFMDSRICLYGASPAFETIVAFGENTSKPHAHPGERRIAAGDVVTIDFGAKYKGYCSDMTRSFAFRKAPEGYEEIYHAVLGAKNAAEKAIRAGMTGRECDSVARDYLAGKGLDKYFTHSLGHSLGIDIHESPNLSPRCGSVIPLHAVTSVEPGVYISGKYGVRIEDIVVFEKEGVDNLTNSPEQLIIV